mmetsp:Transcript_7692/g.25267  ORF Transcript_7692/g.25267 Transcript_7692/m.25267 type:complete len:220 (-) Transcript_7692:112-771(-)
MADWMALPKRKGKKRKEHQEEDRPHPHDGDEGERAEETQSRASANAALVAEAVAKRQSEARAAPLETTSLSEGKYEHLDHTADVQFHAWGDDLEGALSSLGDCFFDYVTLRKTIAVDRASDQSFDVSAADLDGLVFAFLDELLFRFSADGVVCKHVAVSDIRRGEENATAKWSARVDTLGEQFDLAKHPQGTEVKAITYSNMQVHEKTDRTDIFVIVDI